MGRLALLTPSCGGQCADREEKRVAHGNEINRQHGKKQEQLDLRDPNQRRLLTAERRFWHCVETGELPRPFGTEPPQPRIEAVKVVDMSGSNSWAEFAGIFRSTRSAFLEHERAKAELKGLMPDDAKEASGHGVRAKRSKSGAVSFDLVTVEERHAAVQ